MNAIEKLKKIVLPELAGVMGSMAPFFVDDLLRGLPSSATQSEEALYKPFITKLESELPPMQAREAVLLRIRMALLRG